MCHFKFEVDKEEDKEMVMTSILLLMPHFKLTIRYPFCPDDSHTHHLMAIDRIFKVLSLSEAAQKTELLNFIKAREIGC